jgi:hypothetical protein
VAQTDLIPWWGWVLLWTGLVLGAAVVLGLLAWGLVKQGLAVVAEAGTAGARAGELLSRVESLPASPRRPPDVLDEPTRLRAERLERLRRERRVRARVVTARRQAARDTRGAGRSAGGSTRAPRRTAGGATRAPAPGAAPANP